MGMKELTEILNGEVINISRESKTYINPFELEEKSIINSELKSHRIIFDKFKESGFESIVELLELIMKLDKGNQNHMELLNKWYTEDSTKEGLMKIIIDLGL